MEKKVIIFIGAFIGIISSVVYIIVFGIGGAEVTQSEYMYMGIALVIMVVIGCILFAKIMDCIPDIWPSPSKYSLYDNEYNTYSIYNIRNEWLCEKDNLKSLQVEQIENIKACRIMFFFFIVGINFVVWAPLIFQLVGLVFLWIGIGSFWTSFINSSNKLAVYIAKTRGKRSIYLEIEECKRNIAELERIMDKKNIFE